MCLDYGQSGCGGYGVLTADEGYVKSHPAHGTIKYSNNRDCSWNIDASVGKRVRLETLDNIDIEDHSKYVQCLQHRVCIQMWIQCVSTGDVVRIQI